MKHSYYVLIATLCFSIHTAHGAAHNSAGRLTTEEYAALTRYLENNDKIILYKGGLQAGTVQFPLNTIIPSASASPLSLKKLISDALKERAIFFYVTVGGTEYNLSLRRFAQDSLNTAPQPAEMLPPGMFYPRFQQSGMMYPGIATMPVQNPYAMGGYPPNFVQPHMPGYPMADSMMHPFAQHNHPVMPHTASMQTQQPADLEALVAQEVAKVKAEMLAQQNGIIEEATRAAVAAALERLLPQQPQALPMSPSASVSPQPGQKTPHNRTFSPTEQFDLPTDEPVARTITPPSATRAATPPVVIHVPKPVVPVTPRRPATVVQRQPTPSTSAKQEPITAATVSVSAPVTQTNNTTPQAQPAQRATSATPATWAGRTLPATRAQTAATPQQPPIQAAPTPQVSQPQIKAAPARSNTSPAAAHPVVTLPAAIAESATGTTGRKRKKGGKNTGGQADTHTAPKKSPEELQFEKALNFVENPDDSLPEAEQLRLCRLVVNSNSTHQQKEAAAARIAFIKSRRTLENLPLEKRSVLLDQTQEKRTTKQQEKPVATPVANAPDQVAPQMKQEQKKDPQQLKKEQQRKERERIRAEQEKQQRQQEEALIVAASAGGTVSDNILEKHLNSACSEVRAFAITFYYNNPNNRTPNNLKNLSIIAKNNKEPLAVRQAACFIVATHDRKEENRRDHASYGSKTLKDPRYSISVQQTEQPTTPQTAEQKRTAAAAAAAALQSLTLMRTNQLEHEPLVRIARGDYSDVLKMKYAGPQYAAQAYYDALTIPDAFKIIPTKDARNAKKVEIATHLYTLVTKHPELDPMATKATEALRILGECGGTIPKVEGPSTLLTPHVKRLCKESVLAQTAQLTPPATADLQANQKYQAALEDALAFFDGIPHSAAEWALAHLPQETRSLWQHCILETIQETLNNPQCTLFDFAQCARALTSIQEHKACNTQSAEAALQTAKDRLFSNGLPCTLHERQLLIDAAPELFNPTDDEFNKILMMGQQERAQPIVKFSLQHPNYEAAKLQIAFDLIERKDPTGTGKELLEELSQSDNEWIRIKAERLSFETYSRNLTGKEQEALAQKLWKTHQHNPPFAIHLLMMDFQNPMGIMECTHSGPHTVECLRKSILPIITACPNDSEMDHFRSKLASNLQDTLDFLLRALKNTPVYNPPLEMVFIQEIYSFLSENNPDLANAFIAHYIPQCPNLAAVPIQQAFIHNKTNFLEPLVNLIPKMPGYYTEQCKQALEAGLDKAISNIVALPFPLAHAEATHLVTLCNALTIDYQRSPLGLWLSILAKTSGAETAEKTAVILKDPTKTLQLLEEVRPLNDQNEPLVTTLLGNVVNAVAVHPKDTELYIPQLLILVEQLQLPADHPAVITLARTIASFTHASMMDPIKMDKATNTPYCFLADPNPIQRALALAALQQLLGITKRAQEQGDHSKFDQGLINLQTMHDIIKAQKGKFPDLDAVEIQLQSYLKSCNQAQTPALK